MASFEPNSYESQAAQYLSHGGYSGYEQKPVKPEKTRTYSYDPNMDAIAQSLVDIKWILGYIDNYGKVHYKVVKKQDTVDNHNGLWPGPKQRKWRWLPEKPNHINAYGDELDVEAQDVIWRIIDRYKV